MSTTASSDITRGHCLNASVLPVSDDRGYEVVGTYPYGRGVTIDSDGVLDVLHRQDPLSLLTRREVEILIDVFIYGKDLMIEEEGKTKGPNGVSTKINKTLDNTKAQTYLQQQLVGRLRANYTDQQMIDLKLARLSGDPTVLELDFQNFWSEKNKEGLHKIPLNNAGYSMAEINAGVTQKTCTCKAAEADVVLDLAGDLEFVNVSGAPTSTSFKPEDLGQTGIDDITKLLMNRTTTSAMDWLMSQEALRGAVLERQGSSLVMAASQFGQAWENAQKNLDAAQKNLAAGTETLKKKYDEIGREE